MDIQSAHPSLTSYYESSRGDGKFSKFWFVLNELLFLFSLRTVTGSLWPDRMIKPTVSQTFSKDFYFSRRVTNFRVMKL